MITLALLSALITGITAYSKLTQSMDNAGREKLTSLPTSRKFSLEHYFNNVIRQASLQTQSSSIIDATFASKAAYKKPTLRKTPT